MLNVKKQAEKLLKSGTTINKYHDKVCKIMEKELIKLGLFTEEDVKKQDENNPLWKKYYPHGTSHFMGIDVHDVGTKDHELKPGMVFSCEPGIYIPDENIGIRIEDDLLITENEPINLMKNIPIEVEDIERLMNNGK